MQTDGKGYFITFEGCEGSGKSTQLKLLGEYLAETGREAVFTREPGGTSVSEQIRKVILDCNNASMTDKTEALLYAAARAQLIEEKILPAKRAGKIVVCDRYIDSSFAYQAFARGLGYDFVAEINGFALNYCMPDLTLFFDISPEKAFARKGGADLNDRLEQSGIEFHNKVYEGYLELCKKFPDRIVRIDANRSAEQIFAEVKAITETKING